MRVSKDNTDDRSQKIARQWLSGCECVCAHALAIVVENLIMCVIYKAIRLAELRDVFARDGLNRLTRPSAAHGIDLHFGYMWELLTFFYSDINVFGGFVALVMAVHYKAARYSWSGRVWWALAVVYTLGPVVTFSTLMDGFLLMTAGIGLSPKLVLLFVANFHLISVRVIGVEVSSRLIGVCFTLGSLAAAHLYLCSLCRRFLVNFRSVFVTPWVMLPILRRFLFLWFVIGMLCWGFSDTTGLRHNSFVRVFYDIDPTAPTIPAVLPEFRKVVGLNVLNEALAQNAVMFIQEAARADVWSPALTPFIANLHRLRHAIRFPNALPAMPNTNKALVQLWCARDPLLDTSWSDFMPAHQVRKIFGECIPKLLSAHNITTIFVSVSGTPEGSMQDVAGFDVNLRANDDLTATQIGVAKALETARNGGRFLLVIETTAGHFPYVQATTLFPHVPSTFLGCIPSSHPLTGQVLLGGYTAGQAADAAQVHNQNYVALAQDRAVLFRDQIKKRSFSSKRDCVDQAMEKATSPSLMAVFAVQRGATRDGAGLRAGYDAAATLADKAVAEIYNSLDTAGLLSSTIMVLVGDHGEAFGEFGHRQHGGCVHLDCIRVPLLVVPPLRNVSSPPRLAPFDPTSRVLSESDVSCHLDNRLVAHTDVAVTILHALGFSHRFAPCLHSDQQSCPTPLFSGRSLLDTTDDNLRSTVYTVAFFNPNHFAVTQAQEERSLAFDLLTGATVHGITPSGALLPKHTGTNLPNNLKAIRAEVLQHITNNQFLYRAAFAATKTD